MAAVKMMLSPINKILNNTKITLVRFYPIHFFNRKGTSNNPTSQYLSMHNIRMSLLLPLLKCYDITISRAKFSNSSSIIAIKLLWCLQ